MPEDAWDLDMVFADSANEAAFCDNNTGLDYHVPVVGSRQTRPQLNVVHVAVEMAPVAKVGGTKPQAALICNHMDMLWMADDCVLAGRQL